MTRHVWLFPFAIAIGAVAGHVSATRSEVLPQTQSKGGYVVEHDADIQRPEPGTHNGGGQTIGYSFFSKVPKLGLVFRKRALQPGSAIGYHEQKEDEIYYVLSGRGIMTVDEHVFEVGPGTAVLTRPGSSHSLKQVGSEDLVVLINYPVEPK